MSNRPTDADAGRIEAAAADWLVRRHAGLAVEETRAFEAWLAADARHRAAWDDVEAAWATLQFPAASGQAAEAKRRLAARARRRRGQLAAVAALVVLGALGLQVLIPSRDAEVPVATASVSLRPDLRTLADGSTVELNAGAEIAVEFTAEVRAVRLLQGEAHFSVAKNPARPFVVTSGAVTVRAVGTAFAVRQDPGQVGVLVTEGQVAIARTDPAVEAPLLIAAGGRAEMPAETSRAPTVGAQPLSAAEIAAALAWRGHRVEFTRTPLAEAAAHFNRQNRVRLAVADPTAGRLTISGIFWADDPEGFVRLLVSGFGVAAERTGDTIALRLP